MAKEKKRVPEIIKNRLVAEAGFKCACPACPNKLIQIHHIKEYHIYQTNNEEEMIAVCAICHDNIHRGKISLTDDELLKWKKIKRSKSNRSNIYIEPGSESSIILGNIEYINPLGACIMQFSENNILEFEIKKNDIYRINLIITTYLGEKIIEIIDNDIKYSPSIEFIDSPHKKIIKIPATKNYFPDWVLERIPYHVPDFIKENKIIIFKIEIINPNKVKIQGVWVEKNNSMVISDTKISFLSSFAHSPINFTSYGDISKGLPRIHSNGRFVFSDIFMFTDDDNIIDFDPNGTPITLINHKLEKEINEYNHVLEIRPRKGIWKKLFVLIPMKEKESVSLKLGYNDRNNIPKYFLTHVDEGFAYNKQFYALGANEIATRKKSYFLFYKNPPSIIKIRNDSDEEHEFSLI